MRLGTQNVMEEANEGPHVVKRERADREPFCR